MVKLLIFIVFLLAVDGVKNLNHQDNQANDKNLIQCNEQIRGTSGYLAIPNNTAWCNFTIAGETKDLLLQFGSKLVHLPNFEFTFYWNKRSHSFTRKEMWSNLRLLPSDCLKFAREDVPSSLSFRFISALNPAMMFRFSCEPGQIVSTNKYPKSDKGFSAPNPQYFSSYVLSKSYRDYIVNATLARSPASNGLTPGRSAGPLAGYPYFCLHCPHCD